MAKKKVTPEQVEAAERQLKELQRQVEYDTKDYTLEQSFVVYRICITWSTDSVYVFCRMRRWTP